MPSLRPAFPVILPILVGIGALLGLRWVPPLAQLEHLAFLFPERFQPNQFYNDRGEASDFQITTFDFSPANSAPLNIETYLVDEATREIMGPDGNAPVEWAQFLSQTRIEDDRLTVITSSLSWDDASELALLALQEQIEASPALVIGLRAEFINSEEPLPDYLKSSLLPLTRPDWLSPPEIDHIIQPPSIHSSSFGISELRGLKIESDQDRERVPMLVQWGEDLIPTLPLSSLLKLNRIPAKNLTIEDRYLRFGKTGTILRIDRQGRALLKSDAATPLSASKLQIYPTQAETSKIVSLQNSPKVTRGLESQLADAFSHQPRPTRHYQRWHLTIEIALIIILVLLLQLPRIWVTLLAVIILVGASLFFAKWLLLIPLLLSIVTSCLASKKKRT